MSGETYEDGQVACGSDGLTIKNYYFPAGSKHVPYASIHGVERMELTGARSLSKWRIWGSGDLVHWWNLDAKRPSKQAALVLDVGKRVKPTITPDNPDAVEQILNSSRGPRSL